MIQDKDKGIADTTSSEKKGLMIQEQDKGSVGTTFSGKKELMIQDNKGIVGTTSSGKNDSWFKIEIKGSLSQHLVDETTLKHFCIIYITFYVVRHVYIDTSVSTTLCLHMKKNVI